MVPDHQLSLAIGREGQNARLAARLTGWRIDIKSETQILEEETAYAEGDWAEGEWVTDPETGEQTWVPADGSEAMSADDWVTAAEETAVEDSDVSPDSEQTANEEAPSEVVRDDESSKGQEEQPSN